MGKGVVISGGDDGLYSIKLNLNKDRVETLLGIIDNQIAALSTKLAGMEEGKKKEVVKLKQSSYKKKKEYLQNNQVEDPTMSVWCADLTEDVSGNVGTIEIPGERDIVQIQPGYEDNAAYNQTRDGQLQLAVAGTPASVFYNLAMLPGWQKWMPTYRHGIISNIDTDNNTCDVTLDKVKSSQQSLKINQTDKLTGIAIEYMSCDAVAFENGDSVLVEFAGQEWSGAKVVGFKDNPKPCGFQFRLARGDGTLISEASGLLEYFRLYDSDGYSQGITTPIYNTETEYWSFGLSDPSDADPNGYWIRYYCDDGLRTQYPYRYKSADQYNEDDLIFMSKYEDTIPYWKAEGVIYDPEPIVDPRICPPVDQFCVYQEGEISYPRTTTGFKLSRILKSSVPFKTRYGIRLENYVNKLVRAIKNSPYYCSDDEFTCYRQFSRASFTAISSEEALNYTYPQTMPIDHEDSSDFEAGNIGGIAKSVNIVITDTEDETGSCIVPGEPSEEYNLQYTWSYFDEDRMPFSIGFTYV